MCYLQYKWPYCIGYTNSIQRREVDVQYNTDANIVIKSTCDTNGYKRTYSSKILEIGMSLGEKLDEMFM